MNHEWSPRFRYFMLTALVVGLVAFAWYIREAFAPLIMALLLAYILDPSVEWLEKRRVKRPAAVAIVFAEYTVRVTGSD